MNGNSSQDQRPPGLNERDAAFSDIFGLSRPPPGRKMEHSITRSPPSNDNQFILPNSPPSMPIQQGSGPYPPNMTSPQLNNNNLQHPVRPNNGLQQKTSSPALSSNFQSQQDQFQLYDGTSPELKHDHRANTMDSNTIQQFHRDYKNNNNNNNQRGAPPPLSQNREFHNINGNYPNQSFNDVVNPQYRPISPFTKPPPGQQQQQQQQPHPRPNTESYPMNQQQMSPPNQSQQPYYYPQPHPGQVPNRPASAGPQAHSANRVNNPNNRFPPSHPQQQFPQNQNQQPIPYPQQQRQPFPNAQIPPVASQRTASLTSSSQYQAFSGQTPPLQQPGPHGAIPHKQQSLEQLPHSQRPNQPPFPNQQRSASAFTPTNGGGGQPVRPPINAYNQNVKPESDLASSLRTMSLNSAAIRPHIHGTFDREPPNSQAKTLSGRVIPRKQTNELLPQATLQQTLKNVKSAKPGVLPLGGPTAHQKGHRSSSTSSSGGGGEDGSAVPRIPFPHSTILTTSRRVPLVYPALLSKVAQVFRERINLGDKYKDGLTYTNAFTGSEAVDLIAYIIKTTDRNLALLLGRALDAQKFFHDVTYEHRLRDKPDEFYQFNESLIQDTRDYDGGGGNGFNNNNNAMFERVPSSSSIPYAHGSVGSSMSTLAENPKMPGTPNTAGTLTVGNQTSNSRAGSSSGKKTISAPIPVNGVFAILTNCYSPTCTRDQLCYSIACPRRLEQQARLNMKPNPVLKRAESRLSLHGDDEKEQKLWIHTVPKSIADSVSDKEKKRQEVICELIYTERDFVKDLEYIRDFWIKPLMASNIIPESRREYVVKQIFGVINDVHAVNVKLADALTKRQMQSPIVWQVGDIFLEHVPKFKPFVQYGKKQVYAKYEFERERAANPAFAKFVDDTERLKESRKLELNGYLTKPTTRLARYPLLLDAILKSTEDSNPDKQNLPKARLLIREYLTEVNIESGKSENRLQLKQLDQSIRFRPNEKVDLKLTAENRQIIFKGMFKKENQGDVQVYLLDNCILFLRPKTVNKHETLTVYKAVSLYYDYFLFLLFFSSY